MPPSLRTTDATQPAAIPVSKPPESYLRLADYFMELLGCVLAFRRTAGEKQPAYEPVREEIVRLLKQSEACPAQGRCTWEEYDQARYAVCAWIDETVLAVNWNYRGRWRPEMLQRLYYNSTDAGEKFFERLNKLGVHQNGVREVYYLCLVLGFEGRYCGSEASSTREQLKAQHLKLLFEGSAETPTVASLEKSRLFPEAYSTGALLPEPQTDDRGLFLAKVLIGGSALLLLALYFVYRFSLYSVGENVLKAVGKV